MELMNDKEQRSMLKLGWIMRAAQKDYNKLHSAHINAKKVYNDACKAKMEANSLQHLSEKMIECSNLAEAKLKESKALEARYDAELQKYYNKAKQINDDKGYKISYDSVSGTSVVQ